jgi:hypothetical protein
MMATPADTYDIAMGCGALAWEWWRLEHKVTGDNWSVEVTCGEGDSDDVNEVIGHADIMKASRYVVRNAGKTITHTAKSGRTFTTRQWSTDLETACRELLFRADASDFDMHTADELLQLAVLGEVVFG